MSTYALPVHELRDASSVRLTFHVRVLAGVKLDHALSKAFWANSYRLLERKPLSLVEFMAEDGAWEATVRVLSVDDVGNVRFRVLNSWSAPEIKKDAVPKGYKVEFIRDHGWRCLDPSGQQVGTYEPTENDAVSLAQSFARRHQTAA